MTLHESSQFSTLVNDVKVALKQWQGEANSESPLHYLYLFRQIKREGHDNLRRITNRLLDNAIAVLKQTHEIDANLLQLRFLDLWPIQRLAYHLNVAESTVFTLQREAIERLADTLRHMELQASAAQKVLLKERLEAATYLNLIGVEEQIAQLHPLLTTLGPPWLIALEGIGGIGKTSLADTLLRQIIEQQVYDEIGWVSARQYSLNLGGFLYTVHEPALTAEALVEKLVKQLMPGFVVPPSYSGEKLLRLLQARLKEIPHLVVIDNLETLIDVESLLPDYPDLFQQYVMRSVALAHAILEAETSHFLAEDRDRALHLLDFALKLGTAWPATRDLLLLLAPKMEHAGHRDEWLPYLYQGLACSRQQNDRLASAELQLHIGHLYRLQSQFDLAQQILATSADEFATLGNPNGQARALNQLAHMAWHQRQFSAAQHLANTALALLTDADPERAISFSTLGLVAVNEQRLQEARGHIEEALHIRREQRNWRQMAWNMQHLGHVLRHQGDYIQATQYYEKAIQVLTEIQDWYNCAIVQMELGIVYWLRNQPARAIGLYGLAEPHFRKAQDSLHLAKILTNRGLGYLTLYEWQQAIEVFVASATLYEKLDDLYGHLNALDGLGLAYEGLGAYVEAIAVFEAALGQLSPIKDDPSVELLRTELTAHLKQAQEKKERQGDAP